MTGTLTRRAVFGRFRGGGPQLRPPWALVGDAFADACTQCGKCSAACPSGLIARGHAGYPIVSFGLAACTFCGACADVCEAGCFDRSAGRPPWRIAAAIGPSCVEQKGVACRMCEEACEPQAIRFRPRLGGGSTAGVSAADCTGCGACLPICPVKAISIIELVSSEACA